MMMANDDRTIRCIRGVRGSCIYMYGISIDIDAFDDRLVPRDTHIYRKHGEHVLEAFHRYENGDQSDHPDWPV
jgi:hypothetical protein